MGKRRSPSKNVPPKRRRLPKEPEFIDLCPVINPRVLYYIDNFTKDEFMWERAEYQNGDVKIQTKLLDIAVAFATDDVLVNKIVRDIPTSYPYIGSEKVSQLDHYNALFEKLGNLTVYDRMIYNCKTKSFNPGTLDWLVSDQVDVFNSPQDANWYDKTMGHKPCLLQTKPSADRLLQSNYFKAYVKHALKSSKTGNFEFMVERESTKESTKMEVDINPDSDESKDRDSVFEVFTAMKISALWEPCYREKTNTFISRLSVERDFNLDQVFPADFFKDVFTEEESDHFYASFFNALVHKWGLTGQNNEKFDDLPFGNIGEQILDGRFEKLFRFIENRVQAGTMQKIVEKLFDAFAEEFFEFKIEFDEFIEDRWKPNYEAKNSFEEYNFRRNRILEDICENMLPLVMEYIHPDRKFKKSTILKYLLDWYNENRLPNIRDLRLIDKETDLLFEDRRHSMFNFKNGKNSDSAKAKRKDNFAKKRSLFLSRVTARIILVMVESWPTYALQTNTDTLLQILRVLADWGNPLIPGAVTESLLRLVGSKSTNSAKVSKKLKSKVKAKPKALPKKSTKNKKIKLKVRYRG